MPICWIFQIFWLMNFNSIVLAYNIEKCPTSSQWELRAKALCNLTHGKYSCLYDVIRHKYIESCLGKPDYVKPGKRYVIRGDRDNDNCIESRYQPFKLWSNRSSDCDFIKSDCTEMGQVVVSNGSTTDDSTCKCDYNIGFNFVFTPKNVCYCIPSEEDCSCYRGTCSAADELLKTDNFCDLKVNLEVQNGRCSSIVETRKPLFDTSSTIRPKPTHLMDDSYQHMGFKTSISVILCMTIACSCIFFAYNMFGEILRSNQIEKSFISLNKSFLIKEMEPEIMRHALYECTGKLCFMEISGDLSRKEKARIVCHHLEKEPPSIEKTIYEICEKKNLCYLLEGLKGNIQEPSSAYAGKYHKREYNLGANVISANRTFLIEELDVELMRTQLFKKTGNKGFSEIPNTLTRKEKTEVVCDMLEEGLPDILETAYEILTDTRMYLVLHTLQAYTRIFSYTHGTMLKRRIADEFDVIVECLTKKRLVEDIISIFKDRQILQQKVDAVCENFYNDERKTISKLIELVMVNGLDSMLHFVNALFMVGEDAFESMLLRIPDENN